MEQSSIIEILNRHVVSQEKVALLQAITKYPDRFVGVFRSTTPRLKLLQNLLQSREIRFGDALEEIITGLISSMGFELLVKRFQTETDDDLSCDQYFCNPEHTKYYLIEQKVRDDHDSTKKRGQIENFRKELVHLKALHGDALSGIMYFIDPALHKNEKYYRTELEKLQTELRIAIASHYNGELFQTLQGHTRTWDFLLNALQFWRKTAPEQISLNFDTDPELTIEEITQVTGEVWYKLISNSALWENGVPQALFPTGLTLRLLLHRFQRKDSETIKFSRKGITYGYLANILEARLQQYYGLHE